MHKALATFLLFFGIATGGAVAQHFEKFPSTNDSLINAMAVKSPLLAKFNPIPMIWGPIPFTSEYRLGMEMSSSPKTSYQVTGSFLGKSPLFNTLLSDSGLAPFTTEDFYFRGFRVQAQLKYFLYKPGSNNGFPNMVPEGLYISVHTSYSSARLGIKGYSTPYIKVVHFNVNGLLGYQLKVVDGFYLDTFLGLGYKKNTWTGHSPAGTTTISMADFPAFYTSPVKLTLGMNFGVELF